MWPRADCIVLIDYKDMQVYDTSRKCEKFAQEDIMMHVLGEITGNKNDQMNSGGLETSQMQCFSTV